MILCRSFVCLLVLAIIFSTNSAFAEKVNIGISFPGPNNISYLPLDLIKKLGIDEKHNVDLTIKHVGGGSVALSHLVAHAVQFASAGLPAVYSQMQRGERVVAISAINQDPIFVLLVHKKFKNKIKKISDLKGYKIGVNTSSLSSKTTSQQILEILLKVSGIKSTEVNIISAGQKWESQGALLKSGFIDAILCDEPYATRHLLNKEVYVLFDLSNKNDQNLIPGPNFLHSTLITRPDLIRDHHDIALTMVTMLKEALQYITTHPPEEIANLVYGQGNDLDKKILIKILYDHQGIYSSNGNFSAIHLADTKLFIENSFNEKNIDLSKILDLSFTDKAIKNK